MLYMEYLRLRWRVVIFAAVNLLFAALVVISVGHAHVQIDGKQQHVHEIPLTAFFVGASFLTLLMGAFMPMLNALDASLPSVWTRPVPRERTALQMIAGDVVALLALWAISIATWYAAAVVLGLAGYIVVDSKATGTALLGLGTALMAYGNVQAATGWVQSRGGAIAGALFGGYFFLILLSVAPVGQVLQGIAWGLNWLNPMAYFSGLSEGNGDASATHTVRSLGTMTDAALAYTIGICGLIFATFSWKRMEL